MKTDLRLEREFLTVKELATILGMGMTSVYALARTNELPVPAIKVGDKGYRFSRRAVDRVLDAEHGMNEAAQE